MLLTVFRNIKIFERLHKSKIICILSITGLSLLIVTQLFWKTIGSDYWFKTVALNLCVFTYILKSTVSKSNNFNKKTRYALNITYTIFFNLALNNLIDELFFDPETISYNEFLGAGLIVYSGLRKTIRVKFEQLKTKFTIKD